MTVPRSIYQFIRHETSRSAGRRSTRLFCSRRLQHTLNKTHESLKDAGKWKGAETRLRTSYAWRWIPIYVKGFVWVASQGFVTIRNAFSNGTTFEEWGVIKNFPPVACSTFKMKVNDRIPTDMKNCRGLGQRDKDRGRATAV
ncbi:hypothetical protein K474DRAFT_1673537 [Panus rudis PR-1116 ss-1]|nr:hypothetical protein K474DRAFT_1673537 [Panus rudis PR-1116 ss-1]